MMEHEFSVDDAGLAGFIHYFGGKDETASLLYKHGKTLIFRSDHALKYWETRYYQSDYAAVNDATVRMLKMRG